MIDPTKAPNDKDHVFIEAIARDTSVPVEKVEALYHIERADLELVARIRTFIPVLTDRRVRLKLRNAEDNGTQDFVTTH